MLLSNSKNSMLNRRWLKQINKQKTPYEVGALYKWRVPGKFRRGVEGIKCSPNVIQYNDQIKLQGTRRIVCLIKNKNPPPHKHSCHARRHCKRWKIGEKLNLHIIWTWLRRKNSISSPQKIFWGYFSPLKMKWDFY